MNKHVIIIRYSEIHLKGHNRGYFENTLTANIRKAISHIQYQMTKVSGRYLLSEFDSKDEMQLLDKLSKVFGVYSLSIAECFETSLENISAKSLELVGASNWGSNTFKVDTNRADKKFPLKSMELSSEIGGVILSAYPQLTVDIHNPQSTLFIDIRENGNTLIYTNVIKAVNGMPYGTGGKGTLLLSGGIDSPVAGYMMAKRGMSVRGLHFHSFPFTSLKAKDKVISLGNILRDYTQSFTIDMVPFTEIQTQIHEKCPSEFMITIMRRFMMRIAERISNKNGAGAIITGESLGQVASQTIQSINATNAVVTIPVLRPLIGFDKQDIVELSKKIGSYETSILPYEDCCTIFLPPSPATKPKLDIVEKAESVLDIEKLVTDAINGIETINLQM